MTSIVRDVLPEIVPDERILVEDEMHTFRAEERDDGSTYRQFVYTLDKAPAIEVREVYGTVDGEQRVFTEGTDYEVINNKEQIDFDVGGEQPDDNTEFYVTYVCQSVIDRYIESHEEVIDKVEDKRTDAIFGKFVDTAEGQELDELGKAFGKLGKRRGRDDDEYRIYLKSIVRSFTGLGRVQDIRFAVAAAFGLDAAKFTVKEDFDNLEYTVSITDWPPHKLATLVELLDIADPSVVKLAKVQYKVDPEEAGVTDSVSITEGISLSDEAGVTESVDIDKNKYTVDDEYGSDDGFVSTEQAINSFKWAEADVDVTPASGDEWDSFDWEDGEWGVGTGLNQTVTGDAWDFMEWTELIDLTRSLSDAAGVSDAVAVTPNKTSVSDQFGSDDTVSTNTNKINTADVSGTDDSVVYSTESVYWGNDWNSVHWAVEHN